MGPAHLPKAAAVSAALLSGAAIGIALPCTTAAVAIAAALRSTLPAASGAIVATAGFLPASLVAAIFRLPPNRSSAFDYAREPRFSRSPPNPAPTSGWFPSVLLATACAILVLRGGAGLVSPRLVPVVAAGVPLSILSAVHANAGRTRDWLLPAGLLAALALGSPPPTYDATETTLADAFPGERITFTGVVHRSGTSTILQRYVITCCRADAVPVAVRTHRPLPAPDGTWLEARGSIVSGTAGFELAIERWTRVPPPADPFTYR
jgi:hypothetical protein